MKQFFRVEDKVVTLKNGAKNTYTGPSKHSSHWRAIAEKQEGLIGIIESIDSGINKIALVNIESHQKVWWNLDFLELHDLQMKQLLEIESIL